MNPNFSQNSMQSPQPMQQPMQQAQQMQPQMQQAMNPMMMGQQRAFVGAEGSQNKSENFEQSFSDMAYSQLEKIMPEIMSRVATFKIVDSDSENGQPFGNFIILLDNATLYIPVVLDQDSIKPLDLMYVKELKKFLPFSKLWVDNISNQVDPHLGQADSSDRRTVGDNSRDMDIRQVMMPPRTNRKPVTGMSVYASSTNMQDVFLNFADEVPNHAKEAIRGILKTSSKALKYVADNYDIKELTQALTPKAQVKTASEQATKGIYILDKETTPKSDLIEACRLFPKLASELNTDGVAVLDLRGPSDIVNRIQRYENSRFFDSPNEAGIYLIHLKTGEAKKAIVFPRVNANSWAPKQGTNQETGETLSSVMETFLIIFEDWEYTFARNMRGNKIPHSKGELKNLIQDTLVVANPGVGDKGTWMYSSGGSYEATPVVEISRILTKGDTVRYVTTGAGDKIVSQSMGATLRRPHVLSDGSEYSGTVVIPSAAVFLRCTNSTNPNMLISSFKEFNQFVKESSNAFTINKTGSFYSINDGAKFLRSEFLAKTAEYLSVPVNDVRSILCELESTLSDSFTGLLVKKSAEEEKKDSKKEEKKDPGKSEAKGEDKSKDKGKSEAKGEDKSKDKGKGDGKAEAPAVTEASLADPTTGQIADGPAQPPMQPGMQPGMGMPGMQQMQPMTPEQELAPYVEARAPQFNISPELIDQILDLGVRGLFESTTIASLGANKELTEVAAKYMPTLKNSMDTVGRALLALRFKSTDYRDSLGDDEFEKIETSFSNVMAELGDLILLIEKNSTPMSDSVNTMEPSAKRP